MAGFPIRFPTFAFFFCAPDSSFEQTISISVQNLFCLNSLQVLEYQHG